MCVHCQQITARRETGRVMRSEKEVPDSLFLEACSWTPLNEFKLSLLVFLSPVKAVGSEQAVRATSVDAPICLYSER